MNVIGYSERGVMNALFYGLAYSSDSVALASELLVDVATNPLADGRRPPRGNLTVLIEQSFSDFGDADAVVLIDGEANRRCSVFAEAKVKTCQLADWSIVDEFEEFRVGLRRRVSSSILFTQLYHKTRLVESLRQGGVRAVERGVEFPNWSSKTRRFIGRNEVVLKAVRHVEAKSREAFFLMVVPDPVERVQKFFGGLRDTLRSCMVDPWDVSTYGYITWGQVKDFCDRHRTQLACVLDVFHHNQGQIY